MTSTCLFDKLAQGGARGGQYCGAPSVSQFGESGLEFTALAHGCGVFDLGWRACFRVHGEDRTRWLNGVVSNNTKDLPVGRGNYNFVLDARARILGDLYVYNRGEDFVAVTTREQREKLLQWFDKYIIMDQVELAELPEASCAIGLQGPLAVEILANAGFQGAFTATADLFEADWNEHRFLTTRLPVEFPRYELSMPGRPRRRRVGRPDRGRSYSRGHAGAGDVPCSPGHPSLRDRYS